MEAKDTVIRPTDHSESINCPHCGEEFGIESKVEYEREAQAEISFKAGQEERKKRLDRPDRESIIDIFGCSNCVALDECLTDKPMNFCTEKRDHLRGVLALIPDEEELRQKLDNLRIEQAALSKTLDDREVDLLEARREGMRTVVENLPKGLFVADMPPEEGKPYSFLGCYILKWGKTTEPTMGLYRISDFEPWQAFKKEKGL